MKHFKIIMDRKLHLAHVISFFFKYNVEIKWRRAKIALHFSANGPVYSIHFLTDHFFSIHLTYKVCSQS